MKSWTKPTAEQVERAVSLLGRHQQRRYFFDRLENPEWLEPLRKKGVFSQPPYPVVDESGTTYPPWPESKYLARMTSELPQVVCDVMLKLPDTDNTLVHLDLVDAAMAMPTHLAAKWARKEADWLRQSLEGSLPLPERYGDLVVKLAEGHEVKTALHLARALLGLLPDAHAGGDDARSLSPEPRAKFDVWDYYEILQKHVPALVRSAAVPALAVLSDTLERAMELSRRGSDLSTFEDYSFVWRPSIEFGKENLPGPYGGIKDALVTAVRDAALEIVGSGPSRIRELITLLERRPWRVFHRIALHLLRVVEAAPGDLIAERLTDRGRFDDSGCRHEYALLAREKFTQLDPDRQGVILGWIDQGPDTALIRRWLTRGDIPATDEDVAREANRWRRDRLAVLRDSLPHDWVERYRELCRQLGEPQHHEFPITSGEADSPKPAKSASELRSMATEDLIQFLTEEALSDGGYNTQQREALGRELKACVVSDPQRFSTDAGRFRGLDTTYVRNLVAGLREAVAKQADLSWEPVLELFQWIVEQPPEERGKNPSYRDEYDRGWRWSRHEIAHLLSAGLQVHEGKAPIPFGLRKRVWLVTRVLTDDADPSLEDERRYLGPNMDPGTLSINTTRGQAIHTVIRYALWVREYLSKQPDAACRLARGFYEMPEVREILDTHLNPDFERSLVVRACYGWWFPWLHLLDPEWAAASVGKVFPVEGDFRDLRDAAWHAYLNFSRLYDDVFAVLRDQYAHAVNHIEKVLNRPPRENPDQRLAEHLMVLYWRGKILLGEAGGLLTRFFENASTALRGNALDFVGRALRADKARIPAPILARLKALWAWRLDVAKNSSKPSDYAEELVGFASWFVSDVFDEPWAIDQMTEVLKIAKRVGTERALLKHLAARSVALPAKAVECLRLFLQAAKHSWQSINLWREQIREILANAMTSGDDAARQTAVEIANLLGAKGFFEFRDLIQ